MQAEDILPADYLFEREMHAWTPEFAPEGELEVPASKFKGVVLEEAGGKHYKLKSWKLVKALKPSLGAAKEKDAEALKHVSPDSGSFVLVSLRRRRRQSTIQP